MIDPENKTPTVKQFPLEKKKILKKFVSSEIGYFILFFFLGLFGLFLSFIPAVGFIFMVFTLGLMPLFLLISGINWWYQTKYYETYYYDIRKNFLVIKKGVFMPVETTLPFEKLQDVYLDQDIFDRMFGLWDLHVSTATFMSGYNAHIDGVNSQNGQEMREILLGKIKERSN